MNVSFQAGDVLRRTHLNGTTEYIRIGGPNPDHTPSFYVHPCDAYGHLIGNRGRYLLETTLTTRYRPFARPKETYR